jgi:starch synthase
MTKVLMVASEAKPFAKTGGLADVVGSLPAELAALGDEVAVVMPRYRAVKLEGAQRVYDVLPVRLGPRNYPAELWMATERGVPFYFVNCPELFDRDGLYGPPDGDYPDNAVRFAAFSRAALSVMRFVFRPQVVHCHDWQTALAPVYMRTLLQRDPTFLGIRCLFTIHNLGYQGLFPKETLADIGLDESVFDPDHLEFFGRLNLLKGGLVYSDWLSTVSPTYAREIQTPDYGFGLDGVLRARGDRLSGILNGADYQEWNPETDPFLAARYSAADLSGKKECKRDLLAEFGLPAEDISRPLIGIVSRFTSQKGFDLVTQVAEELSRENLVLVALGSGREEYEQAFRDLAAAHPRTVAVRFGYNNPLAHKIEAGSDMFLMPSHYEPCGLNQMYSLRYGTVPIVRATGGLDDTVDETTGFKFTDYSGQALLAAVREALAAYADPEGWTAMMIRGMRKDFSWKASAKQYSALYRQLSGAAAAGLAA